jgi:ATP-dependent helicase HepA
LGYVREKPDTKRETREIASGIHEIRRLLVIRREFSLKGQRAVNDLIGIILWHRTYGYCKLVDLDPRARMIEVQFCGTERRANFAIAALRGDLNHKPLPLESIVSTNARGIGSLIRVPPPGSADDFFRYVIRFDDTGDTAEIDERQITPHSSHPKETLMSRMGSCDAHALYKVQARHQFLLALEELHKKTGGLEALIGSRVELFPHQAFVSGTVINDSVRRFILADEVGLGKTVEAGVVISDILAMKPDARVLVLAPGALSRQWLCELHMSFGAQGFVLADLHKSKILDIQKTRKVICSMSRAANLYRTDLERLSNWDLIVIDEAHHLLWNSEEYKLVENISRNSQGLLLLSAVPAREREDELLRLLRLLDPDRYSEGSPIANSFAELYRAQAQIGQGLRILDRDLKDLETGKGTVEDLQLPFKKILDVPLVGGDGEVREMCRGVLVLPQTEALAEARRVRNLIIERYRLSRRIIKNRRSQLISQEMLAGVSREVELIAYQPDAFESEVWLVIQNLIDQVANSKTNSTTKHAFFRAAYSAFVDPVCASLLAGELVEKIADHVVGPLFNLLSTSFGASYDEYYDFLEDLATAIAPHVDRNTVNRFSEAVDAWVDSPNIRRRLEKLLAILPSLLKTHEKIIIFSGAFGTATALGDELKERLGEDIVEVFVFDHDDADKEQSVLRFRTKKRCRILVSDETGGEGRNFQFASAIVHYDLPWSVAAIEQRIGRLDRIGRVENVKSYVLHTESSIEAGFVDCLVGGFHIFSQSISGLEFMLRDSESAMIEEAISGDWERLSQLSGKIAKAADAERRTDDAEALTDAGSFPGYSQMRYLREISGDLEKQLEETFVAYFRCLASQGSARQIADDIDPNLQIWRLSPDEIRNEPLVGIDKGADGVVAERKGTFRRQIARDRRAIEFFCTGNPLFDAVSTVALERLSGRVFAMRCSAGLTSIAGNYLVIVIRCEVGDSSIVREVSLQRRIRRYFFGKRLYLIYPLGLITLVPDEVDIEALARDCLRGSAVCVDLQRQGFLQVVEESVANWADYLVEVVGSVQSNARTAYQQKFGIAHEALLRELEIEREELIRCPGSFGRDIEALKLLESAFIGWQPTIDSLGILQVTT